MATGIDIYATVNPNYQSSWNLDTSSGKALYTFHVQPVSEYGANVFCISFENDVFKSVGTVASNTAHLLTPDGWTLSHYKNPNGVYEYQVAMSTSDLLNPGECPPVSFWVDYTLLSKDRYYDASGSVWSWNEGDAWSQAVSATNTHQSMPVWLGGGNPSGGTSTTHTPEPATMVLLGSGLAGFGWAARKKVNKAGKH